MTTFKFILLVMKDGMFEFNLRSAHSLFSTITIEKLIAFEIRDNSLAYILPEFNVDPG